MGSGSSGSYSGTGGSSQPYAETYGVFQKELNKDKKDSDIYDGKKGYFENPSATNIEDAKKDHSIYIEGHKANGKMTYVLNEDGEIVFGVRKNPNDARKRAPHPTLIGGKNPKVQCAGMITFKNGKIYDVDANSGHYRPDKKSLAKVEVALNKLYKRDPSLFAKGSKWRKK